MKHSYDADCGCPRCEKERKRRATQSNQDFIADSHRTAMHHLFRRQNSINSKGSRRPIPGSQEWAETRGDDIDSPSGDY